jgi:hypothetical protein
LHFERSRRLQSSENQREITSRHSRVISTMPNHFNGGRAANRYTRTLLAFLYWLCDGPRGFLVGFVSPMPELSDGIAGPWRINMKSGRLAPTSRSKNSSSSL